MLFDHYSLPAFDNERRPGRELGSAIKSAKIAVPPDAVLVSKLNPEIERVWYPDVRHEDRAICSTEFLILRPRAPLARPYLYAVSRSRAFRRSVE